MPDPLGDFGYTWPFYAAAACGYLLGSIPFGLILTRLAGLGDIRRIGSGNIGATNVLRTGNRALATLTLILDGGKGVAAVLLFGRLGPDMAMLAGGGAVIGHLIPIWLKFKGGKGVATALGVLLAIAWPVGILACVTWLVVAALTRYSSLAALIALTAAPVYAWWLAYHPPEIWPFTSPAIVTPQHGALALFLTVLIILSHHGNIRRLITGQEPKIGGKAGGSE